MSNQSTLFDSFLAELRSLIDAFNQDINSKSLPTTDLLDLRLPSSSDETATLKSQYDLPNRGEHPNKFSIANDLRATVTQLPSNAITIDPSTSGVTTYWLDGSALYQIEGHTNTPVQLKDITKMFFEQFVAERKRLRE